MSKAIAVLNYSVFYPGSKIPEKPLDLLLGYDVEEVILTMVALRNSVQNSRYNFLADPIVVAIIEKLPANKAERLKSFLAPYPRFALVTGVVITKILVDLFKLLGSNRPTLALDDRDYEEKILDIVLVYNEYHYNNRLVEGLDDSHELVWAVMMMQNFSGMNEVDYARTGSIKHLIFLRYLRESLGKDFQKLEDSFNKNVGINTLNQFLAILTTLFFYVTKKNQSPLLLPQISEKDPSYPYLSLMDLVIDKELATSEKFDVGVLLSHPFYRTADGRTYLLDHRDFSLLAERGFIYLLYTKTNYLQLIGKNDFNGLLSHNGLNYYEKFLLHNLLKSLERPGFRVVATDDQLLSDFTLIVNETDVFVVEVKSTAIHYKVFDQQNGKEFKKHIDEQFCKKKGVQQLSRSIKYLKNDKADLLHFKKPAEKLNIYPIIIFTDPQVSTYGVNDYVGEISKKEFKKFDGDFKEIRPLTMIHVDFFIENIELLQADRSLLKKIIQDYHSSNLKKRRHYYKVRTTENYVRSLVGFDRYAVGKYGMYCLDQVRIFANLVKLFKLKENL